MIPYWYSLLAIGIPYWYSLLVHAAIRWSFSAGCVGWGGRGGKPQKTSQSPNRQYKAPTDNTKPQKDYTKPLNIRQSPKTLYKVFEY